MPAKLQTIRLTPEESGKTLQEILRTHLNLTNRQAKGLVDARCVFVNGNRIWMARHPMQSTDVITLPLQTPSDKSGSTNSTSNSNANVTLQILKEDLWILAVNKPPGLVSESAKGSVEARLRTQVNQPGLRALHRLDKDTSGVMLFARENTDREPYIDIFRNKAIHKEYIAIVRGVPDENQFSIQTRLDNKEAETQVQVLVRTRTHAVIRCKIPTGRTHQIRRHLLQKDLILVGERTYGQSAPILNPIEFSIPRQMLHACRLSFSCPHTNKTLTLNAPLFADMTEALKDLNLKGFSL